MSSSGPACLTKAERAFIGFHNVGRPVPEEIDKFVEFLLLAPLHRVDPASARKEIEAAGFVFESEIDVLKNIQDDHSRSVFDPLIRGKTDQFVCKFRKPEMTK
jgi:hypothetical protein